MNAARLLFPAIALCLTTPAQAKPTGPFKPTKGPVPTKTKRPKGLSQHVGGPPKKNHGIYLGHRGAVDTGYALEDFVHEDHTISGWWMPHFPTSVAGPLFSNDGSGTYFIGQGHYRDGNGDKFKKGNPLFIVQLGGKQAKYLLSDAYYAEGKWVHIAVTRSNGTFKLYVNGRKQTAVEIDDDDGSVLFGSDVEVGASYAGRPTGNLRLGRGQGSKKWQAYGVLDDVAVFSRALSQSEVMQLHDNRRIKGTEPALTQAWTFDKFTKRGLLTPRLDGPWSRDGNVYHVPLTSKRQSTKDRVQLENPIFVGETHVPIELPFKKNEAWVVIQEPDSAAGSHNGFAAFCWDFEVAPESSDKPYPHGTELAPVYSGAPGELRSYSIYEDDSEGEPHAMAVEIGGGQAMYYLHLDDEHFTSKASGGKPRPNSAWRAFPEGKRPKIVAHEFLARLGPIEEHLHFCLTDDVSDTIPSAFVNYQMSEDQGKSWTKVYRGIPKAGQWIKRIQ